MFIDMKIVFLTSPQQMAIGVRHNVDITNISNKMLVGYDQAAMA